jgi:hypothetical protein
MAEDRIFLFFGVAHPEKNRSLKQHAFVLGALSRVASLWHLLYQCRRFASSCTTMKHEEHAFSGHHNYYFSNGILKTRIGLF